MRSRHLVNIGAVLLLMPLASNAATVTSAPWGKDSSGNAVDLYTITAPNAEVKVTTYGARIVSVRVPDRQGDMGDVVIGYDSVDQYLNGFASVMGATVGRYANRIAGGEFTLNGTTYHIPKNNGNNALHGGTIGFDKKVWSAKPVKNGVEMTWVSPDGDMGFPGNLTVHVTFTLTTEHGNPALNIDYLATTDKPTVVNFTNHSYFNLSGDPQKPVLDDVAQIQADGYTPVENGGIPTGKIEPVVGTPYDFRSSHTIGEHVPQRGYDVNFVLRARKSSQPAAEVVDPESGRTVQVFTTQPGLQFYVPLFGAPRGGSQRGPAPTAGSNPARGGGPPRPGIAAFCLETQHFPDSPNHAKFPSTVLLPGKPFKSKTTYVFGKSGSK